MNSNLKKLLKSLTYALIISGIVSSAYFVYYTNSINKQSKEIQEFSEGTLFEENVSQENLDKLIEEYLDKAKNDPDNPEVYHQLGILYEKKGLMNMAIAQWERAYALNPDSMEYLNDLGRGYFYSGNYVEAQKIFESILAAKPEDKFKLNLAYTYYKLGKYEQARLHLLQLAEEKKDNYLLSTYIANTYLEEDKLNKALEYFEQAKKNNPDASLVNYNQGVIYKLLGADSNALESFEASYNRNNEDSESLVELGKLYYKDKNFKKAIELWKQAAQKGNLAVTSKAQNLIGELYYRDGKISEAIRSFKDSISSDSANYDAYYNLGNLYLDIGKDKESIQYFEKAKDLSKGNYNLLFNLGNAYYSIGQYSKALKAWDYAFIKGVKDPQFNFKASMAFYKTGENEEARNYVLKAIRRGQDNLNYREHLGNIYLADGQFDKALAEFNHILSIDPSRTSIFFRTGKAYYNRGKQDLALDFLSRALEKDETNAQAHDLIGKIYFERGNVRLAVMHWREAATFDKTYANKRVDIAKSLIKKKDYKKALEEVKIALAINPGNANLRYELALCYRNTGNSYKAILTLKNLLTISPDNLKARIALADWLMESGNRLEAISNLNYVLRKDPKNLSVILRLSDLYLASNSTNEAIHLLKTAMNAYPKNSDILFKCAMALKIANRNAEAREYFKKVISVAPKSRNAKKAAQFLADINQSPSTGAFVSPVNTVLPRDKYRKLMQEADKLYDKKKYDKAIAKYREASKVYPAEKLPYYNIAEVYKAKGEHDKATKAYQEYLDRVLKKNQ